MRPPEGGRGPVGRGSCAAVCAQAWPAAGVTAALLLTSVLVACSTSGPPAKSASALPPPPAAVAAKPTPIPDPLPPLADYLQRLRTLPGNELLAETQKLIESADARSRLQAAIALAQPQNPARDDAKAVALAEEVAHSAEAPPALRDLATAVALWLDEQRRADVNGRRAQTKAREDEARMALTESRLRDMERRAQEAEKKLEALRAIERDLSGRGAPNGRN